MASDGVDDMISKAQEEFIKARDAITDRMFVKTQVPGMVRPAAMPDGSICA